MLTLFIKEFKIRVQKNFKFFVILNISDSYTFLSTFSRRFIAYTSSFVHTFYYYTYMISANYH